MIPEEDNLDNCRLCAYNTDPKSQSHWLDYYKGGVTIGAQQSRYNLQTIGQITIPHY